MASLDITEQRLAIFFCLVWGSTFIIGFEAFTSPDPLFTVAIINHAAGWMHLATGIVSFGVPLIALWKRSKIWYYAGIVTHLFFILLDVNRVTPYFICYLGIIYCFCFLKEHLPIALMLIASGIYVFSGLHKFNTGFHRQILPHLWFYSLGIEIPKTLAYIAPAIEILAGIGLLLGKTRRVSIYVLISIHLLLLWKLGPLKGSWNIIVWPWNFMMIATLLYLLKRDKTIRWNLTPNKLALLPLLVFFFLIPSLSLTSPGWSNLGFQLYSGNVLYAELRVPKKLPDLEAFNREPDSDDTVINLQTFSMRRRNIAVNAETWVYKQIKENFENHYEVETELKFYNEWGKPSVPARYQKNASVHSSEKDL